MTEAVLANTLAQITLMRPDPQSSDVRDMVAQLLELDEVHGHIDRLTSGLATHYDLGSEQDPVGRLSGDRSVGHAALRTSLFAEMAEGEGIVLDASSDGRAAGLTAGIRRMRCLSVDAGPSMLTRPNGCIVWSGEVGEVEGFTDALERWFVSAAPRPENLQERSRSAEPSSLVPSRAEQRA